MPDDSDLTTRALTVSEVDGVAAVLPLARLNEHRGLYYVAWCGAEPVGHAYLTDASPPDVQDLFVRAAFRRRGVARTLMGAVEEMALARGENAIELSVGVANEPALALYAALGYRDSGDPPRRVVGTVQIRTGPLEVDDTLVRLIKGHGPGPVRDG